MRSRFALLPLIVIVLVVLIRGDYSRSPDVLLRNVFKISAFPPLRLAYAPERDLDLRLCSFAAVRFSLQCGLDFSNNRALPMDITDIIFRVGLGLVIGFCIGLTGVGGGVLVLPTLTLLLRMNAVMAVGTASLYAFLTKISATFHHAKLKTIDWTLSLLFLAGAIPVNLVVARWIAGQGANEAFSNGLKKFITGMVFFCVVMMVSNLISKIRADKRGTEKRRLSDKIAGKPILHRALAVSMGSIVGALIGATSIGGSKPSVKLPEMFLRVIVIGIILVAAILMLFKGAAH